MVRRTIVKVCGLTRREDASWALACGADWLGFVVHGESPRRIEPEDAGRIVASVGGGLAVAVMVGVTPAQALDLATRSHAARVQLHKVDPATWPADFPLACTFAMGVTPEGRIVGDEPASNHLLLLDTSYGAQAGGTGRTWPWAVARDLCERRDVMLAGGLNADNVGEAIRTLHPFGVDASSSLELSPGIKDPERVRRYVAAARAPELEHAPDSNAKDS
ncbi:MAG: phosphoribosylanthranilate isomerase [Candidatus Eisenbacteria bacterium]|nr:phosphoribosylanthranilate isomerase [Candidatus Eisenbacteria bacterium]